MKTPSIDAILTQVPDFIQWDRATEWLEEGQNLLLRPSSNLPSESFLGRFVSMEGAELALPSSQSGSESDAPLSCFGHYSSRKWRQFVLSTLFADWVSYPKGHDRVSFDRLAFLMHGFPQGFRVFWSEIRSQWWPVGYSGWYPMPETTFETLKKAPHLMISRMIPLELSQPQTFLYLFNYSVAAPYKKTLLSKALIQRYSYDVIASNSRGLACMTVSQDGERIAQNFGMSYTGQLNQGNHSEKVYIRYPDNIST